MTHVHSSAGIESGNAQTQNHAIYRSDSFGLRPFGLCTGLRRQEFKRSYESPATRSVKPSRSVKPFLCPADVAGNDWNCHRSRFAHCHGNCDRILGHACPPNRLVAGPCCRHDLGYTERRRRSGELYRYGIEYHRKRRSDAANFGSSDTGALESCLFADDYQRNGRNCDCARYAYCYRHGCTILNLTCVARWIAARHADGHCFRNTNGLCCSGQLHDYRKQHHREYDGSAHHHSEQCWCGSTGAGAWNLNSRRPDGGRSCPQ